MNIFDEATWEKRISDPHWYMDIPPLMKELAQLHDTDRQRYEVTREHIYDFFEKQLTAGKVALGSTGKNFDVDRKPIDTVVIHHTSMLSGLTKERLSAIDLVRLYAPQYASPTYDADREVKGAPIYSGHFRSNEKMQVFWPYHWMIRTDGTLERLLEDHEIGWQAGNWDINCRSVAIVFDNDFENKEPSDIELRAASTLIRTHYPHITATHVVGHCEVNPKTICPSPDFLDHDGRQGWKSRLIAMI